MFPALLLALAAPPDAPPVVDPAALPARAQWAALAACPRVASRVDGTTNSATATGVAVGFRDGSAYVVTALHGIPDLVAEREVEFFTEQSYPRPARRFLAVEVAARWPEPDLALLRVKVGPDPVPTLPLAGPGQRPVRFPFDALSVGCSNGSPPTCRAEAVRAKRPVSRGDKGLAFFWELAAPPVPGRSGGPLLDDRGRVIGICSAGQGGRGYYTHLDEVLVGLKRKGYDWLWQEK